jgi:hypothetical protein
VRAWRFARQNDLDIRIELVEQGARAQAIRYHNVRLGNQPPAAHRNEPGVARPAADQRD